MNTPTVLKKDTVFSMLNDGAEIVHSFLPNSETVYIIQEGKQAKLHKGIFKSLLLYQEIKMIRTEGSGVVKHIYGKK